MFHILYDFIVQLSLKKTSRIIYHNFLSFNIKYFYITNSPILSLLSRKEKNKNILKFNEE